MADNFTANPGSGGSTFASDDVGGVQYTRVKRTFGRDGSAADVATAFRLISAASTNATSVKGSGGTLHSLLAVNINAAVRYLKLYNKATAPTVGTDTPVLTLAIPGNTAGAGFALSFDPGIDFSLGIGLALTTGVADADTAAVAANDITVNGSYV